MTKCKHSSSTVQADHGNVTLSECDWGCGAILISIERDGITRTLTADEAYNAMQENAKLRKLLIKCNHSLNDEVKSMRYEGLEPSEFTQFVIKQLAALLMEATE